MITHAMGLSEQWLAHLQFELELDYMRELFSFLAAERALGKVIYPNHKDTFASFKATQLEDIKVVILGQDPYHGAGQAHGLCFSVPKGVPIPPSLRNIYKELARDLNCKLPAQGDLSVWAEQGVFLLNSVLTVEQSLAASHRGKGWERFTDCVIKIISDCRENVVFLLWGAYAQKKGQAIDCNKHRVLLAPHPSPLSAHRGFLGCGHFSQTNAYLEKHGHSAIDWQVQ